MVLRRDQWTVGIVLAAAWAGGAGGCKRDAKPEPEPDPMAFLHVQLPGEEADNQWSRVTNPEHLRRFEAMIARVAETADVARPGVTAETIGRFYTKSKKGRENRLILRDDGSMLAGHLEVLLGEEDYTFLREILATTEPHVHEGHAHDHDHGDEGHEHAIIAP